MSGRGKLAITVAWAGLLLLLFLWSSQANAAPSGPLGGPEAPRLQATSTSTPVVFPTPVVLPTSMGAGGGISLPTPVASPTPVTLTGGWEGVFGVRVVVSCEPGNLASWCWSDGSMLEYVGPLTITNEVTETGVYSGSVYVEIVDVFTSGDPLGVSGVYSMSGEVAGSTTRTSQPHYVDWGVSGLASLWPAGLCMRFEIDSVRTSYQSDASWTNAILRPWGTSSVLTWTGTTSGSCYVEGGATSCPDNLAYYNGYGTGSSSLSIDGTWVISPTEEVSAYDRMRAWSTSNGWLDWGSGWLYSVRWWPCEWEGPVVPITPTEIITRNAYLVTPLCPVTDTVYLGMRLWWLDWLELGYSLNPLSLSVPAPVTYTWDLGGADPMEEGSWLTYWWEPELAISLELAYSGSPWLRYPYWLCADENFEEIEIDDPSGIDPRDWERVIDRYIGIEDGDAVCVTIPFAVVEDVLVLIQSVAEWIADRLPDATGDPLADAIESFSVPGVDDVELCAFSRTVVLKDVAEVANGFLLALYWAGAALFAYVVVTKG